MKKFFYLFLCCLPLALMTMSCSDDDDNKNPDEPEEKPLWTPEEAVVPCPDGHHPHVIDLGLSVKWACTNVKATSPTAEGEYYGWGELEGKFNYEWARYPHCNGTEDTCKDLGDIAGTQYDAAKKVMGDKWRMPTMAQAKELTEKCTKKWSVIGEVNGWMMTGPSGKSIFLPAYGVRYSTYVENKNRDCHYWTSTPNQEKNSEAYNIHSEPQYIYVGDCYSKYEGMQIRAVTD